MKLTLVLLSIEGPACQSDNFPCADGECIFKHWVCDGFSDCQDGTDEEETTCASCPFKFICATGRCINWENVCDGTNDCNDNSDEDIICAVCESIIVKSHCL